jgi:hypothetical protein
MKICPQCRTPYDDASLVFCLKDGTPLVDDVPSGFDSKPDTLPLPGESSDTHLYKIADYQRKTLRRYALVEKCEIDSAPLSQGKRYVEFAFSVMNYSMYYVSIPMSKDVVLEGSILFKGDKLSGGAKLVMNEVKDCPPQSSRSFKIRQWVSSDEAADILETLKTSGNLFDFTEAEVYVSGGDKHPDVEVDRLDLTRGMLNADLKNKVIQLEAAQSQYEDRISRWKTLADVMYQLGLLYGMAQQAEHIINFFHGSLTQEQMKYLDSHINSGIHQCLGAAARDSYYERVPPIPDGAEGQGYWIRSHCSMLEALIKQERHKQIPAYKAKNQD